MRGSEYAELAAFVMVAQQRSFRRASAQLGLSPSALSHTIRELEERLGAKLLNRTTRSVAPTEAGNILLDRLAPAFADITAAVEAVGDFTVRPFGTVRLNVPRMAAQMALAPIFGRFARTYPGVRLDVSVDDGLTDVVARGFDAGVRLGESVQRDMIALRITPDLRMAVVASPDYFATRTAPRTPQDLHEHGCINYRWAGSGTLCRWEFEKDDKTCQVAVDGPLTLNDPDLIVGAALDGVGLAHVVESRVSSHLAAGRLLRVLGDWCQPFPGFFLYYPRHPQRPGALSTLIEFLQISDDRPCPSALSLPI